MDTSKFDQEIEKVTSRIDQLKEVMEKKTNKFLAVTIEFARGYFENRISKAVKDNPERAKALGIEGLGEIKKQLKTITDKAHEIVYDHVNKDELWDHRKAKIEQSLFDDKYCYTGNKHPDILDGAVRSILGYAGDIAIKSKLEKLGGEWESSHTSNIPKYKYGYSWSAKMKNAINEYSELYEELKKLESEKSRIEKQKAEAEAADLWDKA